MSICGNIYPGRKACRDTRFSQESSKFEDIPDEKALCFINPDYSCVTCANVDCEDWGTRFASCPDHEVIEQE